MKMMQIEYVMYRVTQSVKKWKCMLCMLYVSLDRAIGQFRKRKAGIIAVNGGHVEYHVQVFNMTHRCNKRFLRFLFRSLFSGFLTFFILSTFFI